MDSEFPNAPRFIIFPPLVPVVTVVGAGLLEWLHPLGLIREIDFTVRTAVGLTLLTIGLALVIRGNLALRHHGTPAHPSRPALKLVTTGVYAQTRNPIYVGGSCVMFAVAFLCRLDWIPILYVPSFFALHLGIVVPEETYLNLRFGEQYRRYKVNVPRYLGPF